MARKRSTEILKAWLGMLLLLVAGLACTSLSSAPRSIATSIDRSRSADVVPSGDGKMLLFAPDAENSAETLKKPYVILVSIDGYRHDFNRLFAPPELNRLAEEGVQVESLQPTYPSKTFPNHYSLVTGLHSENHGLVSNEFYDPILKASYAVRDRSAVENGVWYQGEPIWVTAGKQGMLSASYFWVGSEARIAGAYPNYFYRYDESVAYENRVDQVLQWLKLPEKRRPHLITLYFDAVDSAAHWFGVDSSRTRQAVALVDRMIGRLRSGVKETGLPVNIIVVSDHGLHDVSSKKTIVLDESVEAARILAKFETRGRGPQMLLYLKEGPKDAEREAVINEAQMVLSRVSDKMRVRKRVEMTDLRYAASPRAGDLVIDPDMPYMVGLKKSMPNLQGANHGWDPKPKAMHGVLYAIGPAFKEKTKLSTTENVNVYPLVAKILGLEFTHKIDGRVGPFLPALK